ncbi:MAG: hypothetical protein H6745_22375 [Deltaproteobacteria bacterium]|nr:hypothetical protein [Deltaproteobacteria bacterium]
MRGAWLVTVALAATVGIGCADGGAREGADAVADTGADCEPGCFSASGPLTVSSGGRALVDGAKLAFDDTTALPAERELATLLLAAPGDVPARIIGVDVYSRPAGAVTLSMGEGAAPTPAEPLLLAYGDEPVPVTLTLHRPPGRATVHASVTVTTDRGFRVDVEVAPPTPSLAAPVGPVTLLRPGGAPPSATFELRSVGTGPVSVIAVTVESEQPASLTFADAGVGVSVRSSAPPASPEHLTAPVVIEPGESALVRVALDENLPGPAAISMVFYSDDPRALGGHPVEARTN